MLALYGHPFSSYTWKALIPLYANETAFEFRDLGSGNPDFGAFVAAEHPAGKFPILVDGETTIVEATAIIGQSGDLFDIAAIAEISRPLAEYRMVVVGVVMVLVVLMLRRPFFND